MAVIRTGAGNDFSTYTGSISAYGGAGPNSYQNGAAGTIYTLTSAQAGVGNLLIDNGSGAKEANHNGVITPILDAVDLILEELTIKNGATLLANLVTCETLSITMSSSLSHFSNGATEAYKLSITVTGSANIDTTSCIDVSNRGYAGACGPGAGIDSQAGGAHGGLGGKNLGSSSTYGSFTAPGNLGSGGQEALGGAGGGAVTLSVNGPLNLEGEILARGQYTSTSRAGGAGGSVCILAESMIGGGNIHADGGGATDRGAGGGGRVAVIITTAGNDLSGYTGSMSAYGGDSTATSKDAAAGTVYTQVPSQSGAGNLIIDNGDVGKSIDLTRVYTPMLFAADISVSDLTIRTAAFLKLDYGLDLSCSGNWTCTADMFMSYTTVTFDGHASHVISSNGDSFNSLVFTGAGGTWTLQDATVATGNVNITAGTVDAGGSAFSMNGNLTMSGGNLHSGTGALAFGDAGADSVVVSGGNVVIESDDPDSDIALNAGTWTNTGGTIWYMGGSSTTIFSSLSPYRGLTVNAPSATLTASADIDVNGSFAFSAGTISLGTHALFIAGDVSVSGGTIDCGSAGNVVFDGDLAFTDTSLAGVNMGNLYIGGSPDTTTLGSNLLCTNLTVNNGDRFITAGYDVTVTGNLTVYGNLEAGDGAGGTSTLSVGGNILFSGGNFVTGSSNVLLSGSSSQMVTSGGVSYNALAVSNASGTVHFADTFTTGDFSCVSAGANLIFEAGTTFVISDTVTLTGSYADPIALDS
ncbi:MAG: hypothetical protein HQL31_13090, partial [Planctomycetes bacterium]|nr:hypothetical protein [Planctomycetota bacterium]